MKKKGQALALRALNPDPPAVDLDDSLYEREPDPGALGLWVQFVEQAPKAWS